MVDNDVNGGGDDFDDLLLLEGEDSDKENENVVFVNVLLLVSVFVKLVVKDNVRI